MIRIRFWRRRGSFSRGRHAKVGHHFRRSRRPQPHRTKSKRSDNNNNKNRCDVIGGFKEPEYSVASASPSHRRLGSRGNFKRRFVWSHFYMIVFANSSPLQSIETSFTPLPPSIFVLFYCICIQVLKCLFFWLCSILLGLVN